MNRRKSFVLIAMVALLLTFTVSGTIAWLAASTDELVNTFTPGKIDTEIDEPDWEDKGYKSEIYIENTANSTIPVYVRVSISGYWCDKTGNIIGPWLDEDGYIIDEDSDTKVLGVVLNTTADAKGGKWIQIGDYYYFTRPLEVGEKTTDMISQDIKAEVQEDGSYLVVNVVHQSIQADGTTDDDVPVVTAEWGVQVDASKNLVDPTSATN